MKARVQQDYLNPLIHWSEDLGIVDPFSLPPR